MQEQTKKGDVETHHMEIIICDRKGREVCDYMKEITIFTKYRNVHKIVNICEKQMIFNPAFCNCPSKVEGIINLTLERKINNVRKKE
jgi:hypothetical protein